MTEEDLVTRLRKRAEIRRQIATRKSVQEGKPDRLADLLDEAADAIVKVVRLYVSQASFAELREAEKELDVIENRRWWLESK